MPFKDLESQREYMREYRAGNRGKMRGYQRSYEQRRREADPEGFRQSNRAKVDRYQAANREKVNEGARVRNGRSYREMTPLNRWARGLWARHHMRPEQWQEEAESQGGRCCYCERPLASDPSRVHVEHDHTCTCGPDKSCAYCRRGLACPDCNALLGYAGDDPARLEIILGNFKIRHAAARARIAGKPVQEALPMFENVSPIRREVG